MDENRAWGYALLIGCMVLVGYLFLRNSTYIEPLTVEDLSWSKWINVETFGPVNFHASSRSAVPMDAFNVLPQTSCSTDGKQVKCSTSYTYTANRWHYDHTLMTKGGIHDEMVYPLFTPSASEFIGAERETTRGTTFAVTFMRANGHEAIYDAGDYQKWQSFKPEQRFTVKINRLEQIWWDTLEVD